MATLMLLMALTGARRRVLINLGSLVAGFTLLYSAAGAPPARRLH